MPSSKGAPRPSLLLSKPLSVPGLGSLILIDAVIHLADPLLKDSADDSKKEQVCQMCQIQELLFQLLFRNVRDFRNFEIEET